MFGHISVKLEGNDQHDNWKKLGSSVQYLQKKFEFLVTDPQYCILALQSSDLNRWTRDLSK